MGGRALALLAACALGASSAAQAQTTLRVASHADLEILAPIWTTAHIVRNYGYMVYDTLFALTVISRSSRRWSTSGPFRPTSSPGPLPCATGCSSTTDSR